MKRKSFLKFILVFTVIIIIMAIILGDNVFPNYAENGDLEISISFKKEIFLINETIELKIQIKNINNYWNRVIIHQIGIDYGTLILNIIHISENKTIELESIYKSPTIGADIIYKDSEDIKLFYNEKYDVTYPLNDIKCHINERFYLPFRSFVRARDPIVNQSDIHEYLDMTYFGEYKVVASYRHSFTEPIIAESNSESFKIIQ